MLPCCCGFLATTALAAGPAIEHDAQNKRVTLSGAGLVLRLRYDGQCLLDQVKVRGLDVVARDTGVCTAIKSGGQWFTTRAAIPTPQVETASNSLTVTGIRLGGGGMDISETWRFTVSAGRIVWRIERTYLAGGLVEDTYFPGWDFQDMSVWTGALLGNGGVAWGKLFDAPNASYGVHNGQVTFWNQARNACLRIVPTAPAGGQIAVRFSRQPSGVFSFNYSVAETPATPNHGLSRFLHDRQDVWRPFAVKPGRVGVEFTLSAPDYDQACGLGTLPGLDAVSVRQISHTIARIGVVDELLMGSNGYYSDCAVLHEPWIAQMGLLIDDPTYCRALSDTLDFQRQHAIGADGRVKPRWAGRPGDEQPGTYDALGFYECQWGWLMDSQPSWVINVAELFDLTGDRDWLRRQKPACERVLDYLLRRDTDGNGLVEMMSDSEKEGKASDWINVVWAAHENALVNAQLYWAMSNWAGLEELLGDAAQAGRYRAAAARLKHGFNRSTAQGGFWDAGKQCYAHWRDKDGSAHGANLVVPVNFSAIGYGLCDEPGRRAAILDRIESLMERERLFFWPLCLLSYARDEVNPAVNWPFPSYENGDLFLAWGELGTRVYAAGQPAIALKYVRNVLAQYAKDGLAFQRYLRKSQAGAGNDILANNCSIVVGLYRNLYGIQPKYNRLYLEPHLVPELDGTRLNYSLRGQEYHLDLSVSNYSVSAGNFVLRDHRPFGVNVEPDSLQYFAGPDPTSALTIRASSAAPVEVAIASWPETPSGERAWTESCRQPGPTARHVLSGLSPRASYVLSQNGRRMDTLQSDASGRLVFSCEFANSSAQHFELRPGQ